MGIFPSPLKICCLLPAGRPLSCCSALVRGQQSAAGRVVARSAAARRCHLMWSGRMRRSRTTVPGSCSQDVRRGEGTKHWVDSRFAGDGTVFISRPASCRIPTFPARQTESIRGCEGSRVAGALSRRFTFTCRPGAESESRSKWTPTSVIAALSLLLLCSKTTAQTTQQPTIGNQQPATSNQHPAATAPFPAHCSVISSSSRSPRNHGRM